MTDTDWILGELPENHGELIFLLPELNKNNFFFLKQKSNFLIINNPNNDIYKILKSIRDENSYIKKLLKIKYNLKTFKEAKSKNTFKSNLDESINKYIVYKLSKKHEGKIYQKNTKNYGPITCDVKSLGDLSSIINNNAFIFNYTVKDTLKFFNNEDIIIYYNPDLKEINNPDHIETINILLKQYSKIIIKAKDNPIYKKYFKNWNKKKNTKSKKVRADFLWKNF